MGVFTLVCRGSGNDWTAKQLNGELEASTSCTFELQRKLVQAAISADSSGGVQYSFSYVTPSSGFFFQVIIGGGGGGGAFIGGDGAAAPAASGGAHFAQGFDRIAPLEPWLVRTLKDICNYRMDFLFGNLNGGSSQFNQDIVRCPFLRNINEPTNFSFSTSMAFPIPVRDGKVLYLRMVPILIWHSGSSMARMELFHFLEGHLFTEKSQSDPSPAQFNPLAAKAATISLSGFGPGGPFGFDAFFEKRKKENKDSNSSKKESSSKGGKSEHEAMSDQWLQNGNCPIAKSYRAVSHVLPLVAKALQPPPGMKYRCPPAVVAARSALAKTAFAKNLRPQPLPAKILVIGVLGMAANIPLGVWREHTEKFSPSWFAAVHAAVPFIAMLRKSVLMPKTAMAFTIAASVLGQVIGSRAERHRLKTVDARKREIAET
ncbi:hypothetical protein DH2020_029953 [Rehmannia glutinosa]|uniref:Uncharacterized protein n=1 Tax=Rehmannia glutinosa TaxID=99300 RepID=A0ABR0VQA4_REHGL